MTTLLMRICAISRASFLWCGLPLGTKIFVAFHNWPYQKRTMAQEASIIQNKLNWVQMRCLCQRLKYQIDMILIFEWSNLAESEDIGLNFSLHFFSIFSPLCHGSKGCRSRCSMKKCSPSNALQKMLPVKMLSIKILPKKMLPFKMLPEKKRLSSPILSTDLKLI